MGPLGGLLLRKIQGVEDRMTWGLTNKVGIDPKRDPASSVELASSVLQPSSAEEHGSPNPTLLVSGSKTISNRGKQSLEVYVVNRGHDSLV